MALYFSVSNSIIISPYTTYLYRWSTNAASITMNPSNVFFTSLSSTNESGNLKSVNNIIFESKAFTLPFHSWTFELCRATLFWYIPAFVIHLEILRGRLSSFHSIIFLRYTWIRCLISNLFCCWWACSSFHLIFCLLSKSISISKSGVYMFEISASKTPNCWYSSPSVVEFVVWLYQNVTNLHVVLSSQISQMQCKERNTHTDPVFS